MNRILYLFTILLIFSNLIQAQPIFPENGELYLDTIVPRIDITVDPDTLTWLYEYDNLESDIEFSATFIFDNGHIRDTIYPVGFRLRGNTSRYSAKKSFKVSFNRFTDGGKYYGVEKLNLNGEHNDPSVIRSKICWDILRKMGIPAPRSNHVRVYINGNYYGLYISVEHIDEEFVKSRFGQNDGNLFKCLYPANLNYLGDDPELYKLMAGDRRVYELKTNENSDDYSDLADFIDILNNSQNGELKCKLDEAFNAYDYLKMIAADILFGDWDGYIYNQNNFYLYHNTISGKFEYVLYDLDNTLGIDWLDRDWGTRNIYDWQQHGDNYRPLYERLMSNQEFRDQYTFYMKQLVTRTLDLDSLTTAIEQRRDMVAPYLVDDPYYSLDYGYTINDFYNSYTQALGGHVDYGLFPYLQTRINSINQQLENTTMKPVVKYIQYQRISSSEVWIRAYADVNNQPAMVETVYSIESLPEMEKTMFDDGQHNDNEAGDHIYGVLIDNIPDTASILYQIKVTDEQARQQIMPCEPILIPAAGGDNPLLFINEFMASNESTIADEHGDYEDWIELYNGGNETIWLGDKYLTDNLSKPDKWKMPDAYIEPGAFLLFWADDETDQGPFHTSFKLDKDGEEIGIFDADQVKIDSYVFGVQSTDISEGRLPDGGTDWVFFDQPTPGASNEASGLDEFPNQKFIYAYPNPASGEDIHLSVNCNFIVCNILGQIIEQQRNSQLINISTYNNGLYFVVIENGQTLKILVQ